MGHCAILEQALAPKWNSSGLTLSGLPVKCAVSAQPEEVIMQGGLTDVKPADEHGHWSPSRPERGLPPCSNSLPGGLAQSASGETEPVRWKPLGSRLIVRPAPPDAVTPGGLVIPDKVQKKKLEAVAIAVGWKVREVRVGDVVLTDRFAGASVEIDGEEHRIVQEEDVLAVLR